ncbi:MAG: hypothetical protein ACE5EV_01550, partial [Gaiellales bacterium]
MDVVVTHENADFDAVASLVAAGRLFPSARLARPPSLNRNVREFVGVHQDVLPLTSADTIDLDDVSRLVVVETARRERLGRRVRPDRPFATSV